MRIACGLLFLGFLQVLPVSAQFSGRVTGAVVDGSGSAVPGATVDLYLTGGQKPLISVKTTAEGLYHFIGVRPADYDLTVDAKGLHSEMSVPLGDCDETEARSQRLPG